jgi:hypothetical protein
MAALQRATNLPLTEMQRLKGFRLEADRLTSGSSRLGRGKASTARAAT